MYLTNKLIICSLRLIPYGKIRKNNSNPPAKKHTLRIDLFLFPPKGMAKYVGHCIYTHRVHSRKLIQIEENWPQARHFFCVFLS